MNTTEPVYVATRQRLLEAAGEIFAEQGYRAATIRDICSRAEANVAAVNYHFGDKMKLYAEVLKYAYNHARDKYPVQPIPGESPRDQLVAFIRALVYRILDEQRLRWHGKLMFRELLEPTDALQELVREGIHPEFERLRGMLEQLLPEASPEQILQCVWSVTGQCLFYHHARPVIGLLRPEGNYSQKDMEAIAEHVIRFSLAALDCMK